MADGLHGSMWKLAIHAPHRMAAVYGKRFLVMIDEFQNLSHYVYRDQACETALDETVPGSYHELSESKVAPMLATGSAVGWLIHAIDTYLEAGRLRKRWMSPYLTMSEGIEAIYRYAAIYDEVVTNEAVLVLNRLCFSDPHFIACVIRSSCPDRDLSTAEGVARTVAYETGNSDAELAHDWMMWFDHAIGRINERNAKKILLFMTRNAGEEYNPKILKKVLSLEISEDEIHQKLEMLREAELIRSATSQYRYFALKDGTFYLLMKQRFKDELAELDPEAELGIDEELARMTGERNSLQGKLNNLVGHYAEMQLELDMRARKQFKPSIYFEGLRDDAEFEIARIYPRYVVQAPDGKGGEIDLRVDSTDGRALIIEVKKHKGPVGVDVVELLVERAALFAAENPDLVVLSCLLATGGFREDALKACTTYKIGTASAINYRHKSWP